MNSIRFRLLYKNVYSDKVFWIGIFTSAQGSNKSTLSKTNNNYMVSSYLSNNLSVFFNMNHYKMRTYTHKIGNLCCLCPSFCPTFLYFCCCCCCSSRYFDLFWDSFTFHRIYFIPFIGRNHCIVPKLIGFFPFFPSFSFNSKCVDCFGFFSFICSSFRFTYWMLINFLLAILCFFLHFVLAHRKCRVQQ